MGGRFNLVGNPHPPPAHPPPPHFPTQGCDRSQPVGHESASRAPRRHAPPLSRVRRTITLHKAGTHRIGTQAAWRLDLVHPLPAGTFKKRLALRATQTGQHGLYDRHRGYASVVVPVDERAGSQCSELSRYCPFRGPLLFRPGVSREGAATVGFRTAPALSAPLSPDPCRTGRLGAAGRYTLAEVCTFLSVTPLVPGSGGTEVLGKPLPSRRRGRPPSLSQALLLLLQKETMQTSASSPKTRGPAEPCFAVTTTTGPHRAAACSTTGAARAMPTISKLWRTAMKLAGE